MTDLEFKSAQMTFPWREIRMGNQIKLIDCLGREVPLFTMTAFMMMITEKLKLAPQPAEAPTTAPVPPTPKEENEQTV